MEKQAAAHPSAGEGWAPGAELPIPTLLLNTHPAPAPLRAAPPWELSSALKGHSCNLSYSSQQEVVDEGAGLQGLLQTEINGLIPVQPCCVHCAECLRPPTPPAPFNLTHHPVPPWISALFPGLPQWGGGAGRSTTLFLQASPNQAGEGVQRRQLSPPAHSGRRGRAPFAGAGDETQRGQGSWAQSQPASGAKGLSQVCAALGFVLPA